MIGLQHNITGAFLNKPLISKGYPRDDFKLESVRNYGWEGVGFRICRKGSLAKYKELGTGC